MVFNVYFDPEVIPVAAASPPYGLQVLCDILRGFLVNGLLFDFEDERGRRAIGEAIHALPNDFDRKRAGALFSALIKRNRILFIMEPDYMGVVSDLDRAVDLAPAFSIQLVLTKQTPTTAIPAGIECVTLAAYPTTAVEIERHRAATTGRTYCGGEMADADFLDSNFGNALRHARRIEICDRLVGTYWGDNYEHTVREFFRLLDRVHAEPDTLEVIINCGASKRDHQLLHMVGTFRGNRTAGMKITVNFFDDPVNKAALPHDRYIWTDQFAFFVGRGMDFLDRATGSNRDVGISIKDENEVAQKVSTYSAMRVSTQPI
jgi:hypothetical protein